MKFKDKYTTAEKKQKDEKEKDKTELSKDAFAVGEMIEDLKKAIWRSSIK